MHPFSEQKSGGKPGVVEKIQLGKLMNWGWLIQWAGISWNTVPSNIYKCFELPQWVTILRCVVSIWECSRLFLEQASVKSFRASVCEHFKTRFCCYIDTRL